MAKNKSKSLESKTKSSDKKEKKKASSENVLAVPKAKKKKLTPKVSEDQDSPVPEVTEVPDSAASKEEEQDDLDLEDLTPEERRVLERKLKKERKKEEKRMKKEKGDLVEEQKEEPPKPSAAELALKYLKSWSKKHSEWKFQKTRQTWLLMNMYDEEKVPDKYFRILLDYLGGLKGSARETTIQKAEAYMKECDSKETEEEDDDSRKKERIREVLQLLS